MTARPASQADPSQVRKLGRVGWDTVLPTAWGQVSELGIALPLV